MTTEWDVLLKPQDTPNYIGIAQDDWWLLAISRCCLAVLAYHMNTATWFCRDCQRKYAVRRVPENPRLSLSDGQNVEYVRKWIASWTGAEIESVYWEW